MAITVVVASDLHRDSNKEHGAGCGAGHVGDGEEKEGEEADKWATGIYPGAVFKRGRG